MSFIFFQIFFFIPSATKASFSIPVPSRTVFFPHFAPGLKPGVIIIKPFQGFSMHHFIIPFYVHHIPCFFKLSPFGEIRRGLFYFFITQTSETCDCWLQRICDSSGRSNETCIIPSRARCWGITNSLKPPISLS